MYYSRMIIIEYVTLADSSTTIMVDVAPNVIDVPS